MVDALAWGEPGELVKAVVRREEGDGNTGSLLRAHGWRHRGKEGRRHRCLGREASGNEAEDSRAHLEAMPQVMEAALREAVEETGVDRAGIDVLGRLASVPLPVSGHVVTPVLGWWREPSPVQVVDDPAGKAEVLTHQFADLQPDGGHAEVSPTDGPYARMLPAIRALRLPVREVVASFKYDDEKPIEHRERVAAHLEERGRPSDAGAAAQQRRRLREVGERHVR